MASGEMRLRDINSSRRPQEAPLYVLLAKPPQILVSTRMSLVMGCHMPKIDLFSEKTWSLV